MRHAGRQRQLLPIKCQDQGRPNRMELEQPWRLMAEWRRMLCPHCAYKVEGRALLLGLLTSVQQQAILRRLKFRITNVISLTHKLRGQAHMDKTTNMCSGSSRRCLALTQCWKQSSRDGSGMLHPLSVHCMHTAQHSYKFRSIQ